LSGDLNRTFPTLRIHLAVSALSFVLIPAGAIFAKHGSSILMVLGLLLTILTAQGQANPLPVQIAFRGQEFVLRSGTKTDRISLKTSETPGPSGPIWPPDRVLYRKDAGYAVWDSRGLSVRQGSWVYTTKLPEIPVSPKLFSREEIEKAKLLIEGGARRAEASGLSGALRDGSTVYFLARWDERGGGPWLEALVAVDLTEPHPKPKLLGRLDGQSLDFAPGKSRLFIRANKPSVWVRNEREWGLARFEPNGNTFEIEAVGERPERVEMVDGRIGWFVSKSEYESRILYRWDSLTLNRRELLETRGSVRLLDAKEPWLAVVHEDEGDFLQNLETGGRLRLLDKPGIQRSAFGVLIWMPAAKPVKAVLYEPTRWDVIGRWERN